MHTYKVFVAIVLTALLFSACGTKPTATPAKLAPDGVPSLPPDSIGAITPERTIVEIGDLNNLTAITAINYLYNGYAVHLSQGGRASLEFANQITIRLFNNTATDTINADPSGTMNGRVRLKLERGGLSGEVAKDGNPLDIEISNGMHIYILGTQFFVTYEPEAGVVSVGNFDGTVGYSIDGQPAQFLDATVLVDIYPTGETAFYGLNFTKKQFDDWAVEMNSATIGLESVRKRFETIPLPPTFTPTSTLTPTPTGTPIICPPPPSGWSPVTIGAEETLNSLALKYRTTPALLAQVNCLIEPDLGAYLAWGTQLYVPDLAPTPCQPPYWWIKYTVRSGDTLSRIAQIYSSSVADIMGANCLTTTLIYAGQSLYVPNNPTITPPPTKIPALNNTPTIFKDHAAYFYASTCSVDVWVTVADPEGFFNSETGAVRVSFNVNGLLNTMEPSRSMFNGGDFGMDYSQPLMGSLYLGEYSTKSGDVLYYQFVAFDSQAISTTSPIYAVAIGSCAK